MGGRFILVQIAENSYEWQFVPSTDAVNSVLSAVIPLKQFCTFVI